MTEVQDLSCARCGATLPPSAARVATTCPFCGATAAPVPRVVERVVERIVVAAPPTAEDGGVRRCPRCAEALHAATAGKMVVESCRTCGGLWIDRDNLALLDKYDREATALAHRMVGLGRMFGAQLPSKEAEIGCPTCAKPLRRVKIQYTETSVDICDEHGTWFDWDELKVFAHPPSEDPSRELTPEELEAAGLSGTSNAEGGFFSNLKRLFFGD
jgi:Zn-finger nucleic acid-binding protein